MNHPSPPTIGHLKSMGVTAFRAICAHANCWHSGVVGFETVGVEDPAPFPSIVHRRHFVCTQCGGRDVSIMPAWDGYRASGQGR